MKKNETMAAIGFGFFLLAVCLIDKAPIGAIISAILAVLICRKGNWGYEEDSNS